MRYFDWAATTPVYPELNEEIARWNCELFYNPSALYAAAKDARDAVETARAQVAAQMGVGPEEITFTSGATESNNWVLRRRTTVPQRAHIVISGGEHASIRETALELQQRGAAVTFVRLLKDGCVDREALLRSIDGTVTLVSLIHVNNETGAVNPVEEIARQIKETYPDVFVHSDGVQAYGKLRISMKYLDAYSISGHKIHAPKGIGALYLKKKSYLAPLLSGGGQEQKRRSGTENVPGIVAFGLAAERYRREYDPKKLAGYHQTVCETFQGLPGGFVNEVCAPSRSPHILSCGVLGIRGETLMHALAEEGLIVGMGSACSSHAGGNPVLSAMNLADERIQSGVRISFDGMNDETDVRRLCETLGSVVPKLRGKNL